MTELKDAKAVAVGNRVVFVTPTNSQSVCLSLSGEFSHVCYHNDWTAQLSDIDTVPEGCVIFATLVRDSTLSQEIPILIA